MNQQEIYNLLKQKIDELREHSIDQRAITKLNEKMLGVLEFRYKRNNRDKKYTEKDAWEWLGEGREEFLKKFKDEYNVIYKSYKDKRDSLQLEIDNLSDMLVLSPSKEKKSTFGIYYESSYLTQGMGAYHYAYNRAKIACVECSIYYKIKPLLKTVLKKGNHSTEFHIIVNLDDVETYALNRKILNKGFDLKEMIRQCWKRGVNPRVLFPGLRHGLEEELGLDYFGGYIDKNKIVRMSQSKIWG